MIIKPNYKHLCDCFVWTLLVKKMHVIALLYYFYTKIFFGLELYSRIFLEKNFLIDIILFEVLLSLWDSFVVHLKPTEFILLLM